MRIWREKLEHQLHTVKINTLNLKKGADDAGIFYWHKFFVQPNIDGFTVAVSMDHIIDQLEFPNFILTNIFEELAYEQLTHNLEQWIFFLILRE